VAGLLAGGTRRLPAVSSGRNLSDFEKAAALVGGVVAGKYELVRVLGVGGMGAVYEALHRFTGKRVAVKLLHGTLAENENHARRFLREARAASAIGHPAIVDVLDAGQEAGGMLYLVLELLEGQDLAQAIYRRDLRTEEVVDVALQLLDGLSAAHERGIVHRDVKPENVYLVPNEKGPARVKILDFGIAKNMATPELSATVAGTILGTPFYMSPEQARGETVDARTDVWSTGALLFHCLAGRPPFIEENYNKLIVQILREKPPTLRSLRPDLPDAVLEAVERALQPDLELRWKSAREMAGALRGAVGLLSDVMPTDPEVRFHAPTESAQTIRIGTAPTLTPQVRSPSGARRERMRRMGLVAGGLVLLAAVGSAMVAVVASDEPATAATAAPETADPETAAPEPSVPEIAATAPAATAIPATAEPGSASQSGRVRGPRRPREAPVAQEGPSPQTANKRRKLAPLTQYE